MIDQCTLFLSVSPCKPPIQGLQQCIMDVWGLQSISVLLQIIIDLVPATFYSSHDWPGIRPAVGNGNWTTDLSQTIFLGQLVAPVCFTPVYCVHHKGILSPPSWSYQSLAELRGVGKVVHTTGGSIHTADSPQRCLLCLFDSSQASVVWALFLSFVFFCFPSVQVFTSEETLPGSEVDVTVSRLQWHFLFFIPVPEQEAETESESDRQRGRIARNVLNFLIISLAAYALM